MPECEKCIHETEIQELKKDMERNSATHREFYNSFKEMEIKQGVTDNTIANIFSVMTEIKDDVKEIKEKPSKKWDNISLYVVTSIISAVIGYFIKFVS